LTQFFSHCSVTRGRTESTVWPAFVGSNDFYDGEVNEYFGKL